MFAPKIEYSHVIDRVLDNACLGLTEPEFADLALAAADQAGVDVETQAEIRRLIDASRAKRRAA